MNSDSNVTDQSEAAFLAPGAVIQTQRLSPIAHVSPIVLPLAGSMHSASSRTTPSAAPPPHQKLDRNEIQKRIDEAIARLSPEHRAVIVMKEMEDLQYNEIAEILGCSIGTVMSRLFYARKKLKASLRDVYEAL